MGTKKYDRGPKPLVNEKRPLKPKKEPLGFPSKTRDAYLVSKTGSVLDTTKPLRAHGSVATALEELARRADEFELRVLQGEKWYESPETWDDETGEPVALTDDSVAVVAATCTETFSRSDVFGAWLRSLLLVSNDVARAEKDVLEGRPSRFTQLLRAWDGLRDSLAERTLVEARRARTIPSSNEDFADLFKRTAAGDLSACPALEMQAFRRRNLMAWRFARAMGEGKNVIANMYRSRVSL